MILDHIAIAVRSLDLAMKTYVSGMGFELEQVVTLENQKVRVAVLPCGTSRLELMEPTDASSPIQRFLDRRGEGLHHVCFIVDNLEAKLQKLQQAGMERVGTVPPLGLENRKVAFLYPKSAHGVLIELVETSCPSSSAEP
ncbi:MAG: methylmalonyl-CoA epimerase [Acidobacteriota bacterium]